MSEPVSLLDTAYKVAVDVWVVFADLDQKSKNCSRSPFWKLLKPGFRHVEVWKFIPPGAWIRMDTAMEMINVEVFAHPPWELKKDLNPTCMRVNRLVSAGAREPFFFGPVTCVELTKAFIGVGSLFIRTPFQLYKFLKEGRDG